MGIVKSSHKKNWVVQENISMGRRATSIPQFFQVQTAFKYTEQTSKSCSALREYAKISLDRNGLLNYFLEN
jgi:hypothetical protein